jgi:hypothetical protein
MSKTRVLALAGALLVGSVAAQATFYTSESSFLAAINPTFYLEDFTNWTFGAPLDGTQLSWAAPGANGYGWTASSVNGLFSTPGALSTDSSNDPVTFTFTGAPVKAFGGIFGNTDVNGAFIAGTVTLLMSNGDTTSQTYGAGGSGFIGWTSNTAIASVTMSATSGALNNWIQGDHIYTGTVATVPEPMTVTGLAIGALALLRRRNKKA